VAAVLEFLPDADNEEFCRTLRAMREESWVNTVGAPLCSFTELEHKKSIIY
jgi:hypothetical protein